MAVDDITFHSVRYLTDSRIKYHLRVFTNSDLGS